MSSVDWTKPVQTRGGKPVRVLCTDRKNDSGRYVVGLVQVAGQEYVRLWKMSGSAGERFTASDDDVINVPEERVAYMNIYDFSHPSRKAADIHSSPSRLACKRVVFKVGEFDE